jgi:hypothetical protein
MPKVPPTKTLRNAALKSVAECRGLSPFGLALERAWKMTGKGVFGRLARPAKRHYTFARRRLHGSRSLATNAAYQAHNALIFRLF